MPEQRAGKSGAPEKKTKKPKGQLDVYLIIIVGILLIFGLIMLTSASSYTAQINAKYGNDAFYFVKRQALCMGIGIVFMFITAFIPYSVWKKIWWLVFGGSFLIMFLVVTPLGFEVNGARRWLSLGSFSLQPAELLKIGVIIASAAVITICIKHIKQLKAYIFSVIFCIAGAGVTALVTDDLGTAVIIVLIGFIMLIIVGADKKHLLITIGLGLGAVAGMIALKPYRFARILAWFNVEANASGDSYQIMQALYAIGSGGFFGKGLGKSTQKLGFVPESQNDMIFSIICEELGIVGALVLIALFVLLILRLRKIYNDCDDIFGKLIVAGVMIHLAGQAFINMGVVTSLLPNTGVPLPFISNGGTAVIFTLVEIGLALSVGFYSAKEKAKAALIKAESLK
ncbi:MAG: cell division protein FtsW [Parasporobacterium sp.]|nr:cell division protein FtsW [Parasporobacterium sp.]